MTRSELNKRASAGPGSAAGSSVRDGPAQHYPGEHARQGRIILNTPARRTVFVAGLIGAVLLAFAVAVSL